MNDKVKLNEIKQAINDLGKDLSKRVNEQAHAVSDKIKQSTKVGQKKLNQMRGVIEKNPIAAVGIAAAVGLIIGRLFKSRKRD